MLLVLGMFRFFRSLILITFDTVWIELNNGVPICVLQVRQHLLSGWPRFGSLLHSSSTIHSGYSGQNAHQPFNGFEFTPFSFVLRILCMITFIHLTSTGSQIESNQQSTLLFVFTLSRHGDRTPLHQPLNDSYKSLWSNGKGQLTRLGVQQHVELGRYIRQQYGAVLPAEYHKVSFVTDHYFIQY